MELFSMFYMEWYTILGLIMVSYSFYKYISMFNITHTKSPIELSSEIIDDVKCVKYEHKNKKYVYLTHDMTDNMDVIHKKILQHNINSRDKQYRTPTNIEILIVDSKSDNTIKHSIVLDDVNFISSISGPSDTHCIYSDAEFNNKLTKLMNHLFILKEGILSYGRLSFLLPPNKYFEIKSQINKLKKDHDIVRCKINVC